MAGGNLSPRQKMINLMYLVFIAMLALNMSKEVLSAFGLMNEKIESSNTKANTNNANIFAALELKASEQPDKFGEPLNKAKAVKQLSDDYYSYLETLKNRMTEKLSDKSDYEVMDKADFLDQTFFKGGNYSTEGKEFVDKINAYREGVLTILGEGNPEVKEAVKTRFNTGDNGKVKNRDGRPVDWLNYHFEGFPLIASLTKITQMQAEVKSTEEDVFNAMFQGQLKSEISMTNYTTLLEQTKGAYYQGERFDGSIVLGRKDNSTKPNEVELFLDGRKLSASEYEITEGKVKLNVGAGNAGDHKITGNLYFDQDGERLPVEVSQTFSTIPKPNAAVISADKMNVVYRGVANPITISMPGVPDNKVNASAPGLSRFGGSKYVMNPGTGREVTINVTGEIDGKKYPSSQTFRIKDIPRPTGTVSSQSGEVRLPRANLEIATISAMLEDFDFDLKLSVRSFKISVPGQPSVQVTGSKMNSSAINAIKRAKRGDIVQIFDIEASIIGNTSYRLKKVAPVVVEITN